MGPVARLYVASLRALAWMDLRTPEAHRVADELRESLAGALGIVPLDEVQNAVRVAREATEKE